MTFEGQPLENPEVTATGAGQASEGDGAETTSAPTTRFVGGREQTWDETIQNYEASRAEAERWKAVAAERERIQSTPSVGRTEPALPSWAGKLVELGVPAETAREMVDWNRSEAERMAEQKSAAKVQELIEGIAEVSTAEARADAALGQAFEGYSKTRLDAHLTADPAARSRYEKVAKADIESAKRLAWLELSGGAGPKGSSRATEVPTSRRPVLQKPSESLEKLREAAKDGTDDKATAAYLRAMLGGKQ